MKAKTDIMSIAHGGAWQYRLWQATSAYVITMRPYLMFVSGITGIAGLSITSGLSTAGVLRVSLASFLSYGFGQALTDCYQMDTDSLSSPYRPLVRGVISRPLVLAISLAGLTLCVCGFGADFPPNMLLGLFAGIGLATYTPFKRRWWAGPFYNAWIVALLCFMACLSPGIIHPGVVSLKLIYLLACVFFGYANFVLTGYFKDIAADRKTGYQTLPVRFGRSPSAIVSDIFAGLALCFGSMAVTCDVTPAAVISEHPFAFVFWSLGLALLVEGQIQLHGVRSDDDAFRGIIPGVHAYILLLSAIAVVNRPDWGIPLVLFYGLFMAVLARRPMKGQI